MKIAHYLITSAALAFACGALAQVLDNAGLVAHVKKNKEVSMKRDEFETPAQAEVRLARVEREFAVVYTPKDRDYKKFYEYDATTETLIVHLSPSVYTRHGDVFEQTMPPVGSQGLDEWMARGKRKYGIFVLQEVNTALREWTGQNAYGAKVTVTSFHSDYWGVVPLNIDEEQLSKLNAVLGVPAAEARALTKKLAWRLVGRTVVGAGSEPRRTLHKNWPIHESAYNAATIDDATEFGMNWYAAPSLLGKVQLVRKDTGEVLYETSVN